MEAIINSLITNRLGNDVNTIIGSLLKGGHINCTTRDINAALEMIFEKRANCRTTYIDDPIIVPTDISLYVNSMKGNGISPDKIVGSLVAKKHIAATAKDIMEVYNSLVGERHEVKAYNIMIRTLEREIERLKAERDSL